MKPRNSYLRLLAGLGLFSTVLGAHAQSAYAQPAFQAEEEYKPTLSAPKPRKQVQIYKRISGDDVPKEIRPVQELQDKVLFLRDALGGYSDGMLVERYLLLEERLGNQSS